MLIADRGLHLRQPPTVGVSMMVADEITGYAVIFYKANDFVRFPELLRLVPFMGAIKGQMET